MAHGVATRGPPPRSGFRALGSGLWAPGSAAQPPPNIVLFYADDLGYTDLSCQGSEYYETPNIDRLAREGMTFTQAYAAAANCAPSRASLLTGLYTPRHGIFTVGNSDRGKAQHRKLIPIENTTVLRKDLPTLPQVLRKAGYRTAIAGKWHLSKDPRYNLRGDPGEQHNAATDQPARRDALHAALQDWRQAVKAPVPMLRNPPYRD